MHIRFSRRIVPVLAVLLIGSGLFWGSTATAHAAAVGVIDTTNKDAVTRAYNYTYLPTLDVPVDWTGSVAGCVAGAPSAAAKDAILTAFNYMRAMAGLPSVTEDATASAKAQEAALMMQANRTLSHGRPKSWDCYTQEGSLMPDSEIIASNGTANAIPLYMLDPGGFNQSMGHRAAVLSTYTPKIGIGSTPDYNAIQWSIPSAATSIGNFSWPSKGYFPYELIETTANRWSFYPASGSAENATVSVTKNGTALAIPDHYSARNPTTKLSLLTGLGWGMPEFQPPANDATDTYRVTINGIEGGSSSSVTYEVLVYAIKPTLAIEPITIDPFRDSSRQLKLKATAATTPADASVQYFWWDGDTLACYGQTYYPRESEAGRQLQVQAAASKPGWRSASTTLNVTIPTKPTVTFDPNGGVVEQSTKQLLYLEEYGTLPTVTRSGYVFLGWYTKASGGTKVLESTKVTTYNDHTLYAQWEVKRIKVAFDTQGDSPETAKSVTTGGTYGDLPTPTRTGYAFQGWFTAASGGTKITSASTVYASSDHTLVAQWKAQTYKVTFDSKGGSAVKAQSVVYDSAYGVLPTPTRSEYVFSGWFTSASGGTKVESTTRVTQTGDRTLYARWQVALKTCATGTPTLPMKRFTLGADMTGDRLGDVLAVDSKGVLWQFPGKSDGTLGTPCLIGNGFSDYQVFDSGDIDGDGRADVLAISSDGKLWLFHGNGTARLSDKRQVGRGWTAGWRLIPAGDLNGDKKADLLGIAPDGYLYFYAGKGNGGFQPRVRVGSGWTGWGLYAAGDLNGDGKNDILGVNPKGLLYQYTGKGSGFFNPRTQAGTGWSTFTLASGADITGDKYADILGRNDRTGELYFYKGKGNGHFAPRVRIATGW